jgi:tetratricopeptide (TPR) repeat protein
MIGLGLLTLLGCRPSPPLPDPPDQGGPGSGETAVTETPWESWDNGNVSEACDGFEAQEDLLGLSWCALASGDLAEAVGLFEQAVEGEATADNLAGLAVAQELTGEIQEASASAYEALDADPDYSFGHAELTATDLWRIRTRAALLRGDLVAARQRAAEIRVTLTNPYDPGSWTTDAVQAGAFVTIGLVQLEEAP